MDSLEEASRYVEQSQRLREALDIDADALLAVEALGNGEHNANFTFTHPETKERFVLRINYASQLGLEQQVSYEAAALRALEPSARTPRLLFVDDSKEIIAHGVLVESFEEGELLDFENATMVAETAAILADIHAVEPAPGCGLLKPRDPLRAQFDTCCAFYENYRASGLEEAHVVRYVDEFLRRTRAVLDTPFGDKDCCHIVNTEAVPSHFIMPLGPDGSVVGRGHMLDWEKPIIGEAAQDIAYFLSPTTTIWDTDYIFDAPARDAFVKAYWKAVDGRFPLGSFEDRFNVYVMSNCLLGITWSCNAWVEYHDPSRPLKNDKTFELLKTYLSESYLAQVYEICF